MLGRHHCACTTTQWEPEPLREKARKHTSIHFAQPSNEVMCSLACNITAAEAVDREFVYIEMGSN